MKGNGVVNCILLMTSLNVRYLFLLICPLSLSLSVSVLLYLMSLVGCLLCIDYIILFLPLGDRNKDRPSRMQ